MPAYRARVARIKHAAIDKNVPPTGHGIAVATGLPAGTLNAMFNGRTPSSITMATLCRFFEVTTEELFEIVDVDGDPAPALAG